MLIRDLILPDGNVLEYSTGNVVQRSPRTTDMSWGELAGSTPAVNRGNTQPFVGCQTGGDLVAEGLMNHLATK